MLPAGVTVFERGWLSANNILLQAPSGAGSGPTALVDSGYWSHSEQTLALVKGALAGRPLDCLINTHLHSDHCGGNAALQAAYPALQTWIPPGHAEQVRDWDAVALTYTPTGQTCPRFRFNATLEAGSAHRLGGLDWEVHAAPGHDPHSILLYAPEARLLISADALWENGFGVVFPELEGLSAFDEVAQTLDLIEKLAPLQVIPGHGAVFTRVDEALINARRRLDGFRGDAAKHGRYAAKVLLKFKLLEMQQVTQSEFQTWAAGASYLATLHASHGTGQPFSAWLDGLVGDLVNSGAALIEEGRIRNI